MRQGRLEWRLHRLQASDNEAASLELFQNHSLIENLIGTKPGDHICVIYDYSPVEQMEAVAAFLKEGLEAGEQSIYVADDDLPIEHLTQSLRIAGIDVTAVRESNALLIWTREHWRQPGPLDTIRKAAQVREVLDTAFAAGFTGVRFAVDMTWTLKPDIDVSAIEAWESYSNGLLQPGAPIRAMCLYGRKRLPGATMTAGLQTHPLVLDDEGLQANAEYRTGR
jgi:hypothetical protein